jgi:hypothetical protein
MSRPRWPVLAVLLLILAATALRIEAALRPGLWGDEIFSLAIATGHSLEHPAAEADSSLGDFVEPREARSPTVFRRYTEHDAHPAGLGRVSRAVLLSDTSPPLYYLLLNRWTRVFGTDDGALRLFSVWWAMLSLPLLWALGNELGRPRAAWTACLLFSFSPVAIYYSVEGRMYSLVWCLALCLAWLTLRLSRRDRHAAVGGLWVLAGAAGLLTHYFFAFVWLACLAWLWLRARPPGHGRVGALAAVTVAAVLPWYVEVPASLARWRVSGHWLDGDLAWPRALAQPFVLAWGLLGGANNLGGWRPAESVTGGLFLLLGIWLAWRGSGRRLFASRRLLLWAWVAAACCGPLAFDVLRHTTTVNVPRYALAALPAVVLLAALAMSRLPPKIHLAFLSAIQLAWIPGGWANLSTVPRPWEPYRTLDADLDAWARPGDLVLIHSLPSGVIGVARYLKRDIPLASWVAQLGTRDMPDDLEHLLDGRRGVALVKIHYAGAAAPAEAWLRTHARLLGQTGFRSSSAEILYFAPSGGDTFVAGPPEPPREAAAPR